MPGGDFCHGLLCVEALARARSGRGKLYQYDIFDSHSDLVGKYDYVFLFDVLEHIEQPKPFVSCVLSYVKPGGLLFVNVPAMELLRSEYDDAAGHFRRYSVASLGREFDHCEVKIRQGMYWGFSMVPLLLMRKLAVKGMKDEQTIIRSGFRPPHRWMNSALRALSATERALLRRPPCGSSVMMAIEK